MAQGPDRRARWLGLIAGGRPDDGRGADPDPSALRAAIAETRDELARHLGALKQHLLNPRLSNPEPATEIPMATTKKKAAARPSAGGAASKSKAKASARPSSSTKGRASASATKPAADRKPAATPTKPKSAKAKASSTNPSRSPSAASTKSGRSPATKSGASRSKAKAGSRRKSATWTLLEKTGGMLDTVIAGAVVGAVTGAAQSVAGEPTAVNASESQALASSPAAAGGPGTQEVLGELAPGAAVGALSGAAKSVLPTTKPGRTAAKKSAPKKKG
jgi:hypothetical protein